MENKIQGFISSLSKDDKDLIEMCYQNPFFVDFDAVLFCVKEENPIGCEEDFSIVKRLADFERKYRVKLYELLDIPKLNYKEKKQFIYEGLTLTVDIDGKGKDITIRLDNQEQITLHMRDNEFRGSWDLFKQAAKDNKFIKCLAIDKLRKIEEKYTINLGVLMRMYPEIASTTNSTKDYENEKNR